MKRYGNLFNIVISEHNLLRAHYEARRGKGHYVEVREFEKDLTASINQLHCQLLSGTWSVGPYRQFVSNDSGKERVIDRNPSHGDNIVQHAIQRTAGIIMQSSDIRDSYSGIRGRGIHDGVRMRKSIERRFRRAAMRYHQKATQRRYRALSAYWGWIKSLSHGERLWYSLFDKPLSQLKITEVHS